MNKHFPKDPAKGGPPTPDIALSKALSERYLAYALATITSPTTRAHFLGPDLGSSRNSRMA